MLCTLWLARLIACPQLLKQQLLQAGETIGESGMGDSNPQPHAPEACALANCANPRRQLRSQTGKPALVKYSKIGFEIDDV